MSRGAVERSAQFEARSRRRGDAERSPPGRGQGEPALYACLRSAEIDRMPKNAETPKDPHASVTVLCCVDARLQPHQFIPEGTPHVWYYRNAGGRVTDDFLRTVLITQLNGCRHIMVVHHTKCGLHAASNATFRERTSRELQVDASGVDFLPWADLEEGVREDVRILKKTPLVIAEVAITGHVYDIEARQLRDIETESE